MIPVPLRGPPTLIYHTLRYDARDKIILADNGASLYQPLPASTSLYQQWYTGLDTLWANLSYTHGGGIDRPLVITREGVASIVPHVNWRGQFAMGTYADGPNVGRVSDCGSFPAQNCVPIQWPGERTTVYHELTPDRRIQNWFGSLVDDMRDATGQMYRRNRYYDPQTGQFTQPDPIGLAGGLNAYGFAEGDPVSYSDPYGLCAWGMGRDAALNRRRRCGF